MGAAGVGLPAVPRQGGTAWHRRQRFTLQSCPEAERARLCCQARPCALPNLYDSKDSHYDYSAEGQLGQFRRGEHRRRGGKVRAAREGLGGRASKGNE